MYHRKFSMLDKMLLTKFIKKEEKDKTRVGESWMNFTLNQIFGPTFSSSFNQILILDAFGQSFI